MNRDEFYQKVYYTLSEKDIAIIFQAYLRCPDFGSCEQCVLNNNKIGCFKLRDLAMQKVIDNFNITPNEGINCG